LNNVIFGNTTQQLPRRDVRCAITSRRGTMAWNIKRMHVLRAA
jgi:hypothetical protein